MSAAPRVSVIVPSYQCEGTIAATLRALVGQTFTDFETIVVDSSPGDATARLIADRFPAVLLCRSPERLLPHAARNRGVELAGGELLVFTDPDCVPRPDWLERLVSANDHGHPVVGGAIELAQGGWVTAGIHLSKFAAWSGGGPPGTRPDIATANALWSRPLVTTLGPFPVATWCGDTEVSWRTRGAGIELRFEPGAVVTHTHQTGFRAACRERYARGEDFARMRIRVEGFSRVRAAIRLLAVPVVPALLLGRALRYALRSGRLGRAVLTAPVQLTAYAGWSLGEGRAFAGAVIGR